MCEIEAIIGWVQLNSQFRAVLLSKGRVIDDMNRHAHIVADHLE
jgi:hypothetical protein